MRRSAAMKKQVKAMQSMDERMARIEAALGITQDDPSPQEQGGEQDSQPETPSVKWDDLGSYTLAELKEIAETHEIDLGGSRTAKQVTEAILAWVEQDGPADDSVPNGDTSEDDAESEEDEE